MPRAADNTKFGEQVVLKMSVSNLRQVGERAHTHSGRGSGLVM